MEARTPGSSHYRYTGDKRTKKRQELEEKNKRKAEREQKKKEREEAVKKKAEERTKKKEKLAKKRDITTRKTSKSTGAPTKKRNTSAIAESDASSSAGSSSSSRQSSRSAGGASLGKDGEPEVSINSDECCVCFRTFQEDQREGTGLEWVQCVCHRWLHEECICEIEYDEQGRELLCPNCAI